MELKEQLKFERRLKKVSTDLNKLIADIKKHYPDANYMCDGNSISVITEKFDDYNSYSEDGPLMSSNPLHDFDCGDWN